MNIVLEQLLSKKLGIAVIAMVVISQIDADHLTQGLIAGLAALHVVCQTAIDYRRYGAAGREGKA